MEAITELNSSIEDQINSLSNLISDEYDLTFNKMKETNDIQERRRLLENFFNVFKYDRKYNLRVYVSEDLEYTCVNDDGGIENDFTIDYEKMIELNDGYARFVEWIQFYGKESDRNHFL